VWHTPVHVQQGVDLGDGHGLRPGRDLDDVVASLDSALLEHPEVEPWTVMGNQHGRHPRVFHSDSDPVARHPGLGYLEHRFTDPVPVADAHLIVSPWPSPSIFRRRTSAGPSTGRFHTAVCTVRPFQARSCGMPALTESKRPAGRLATIRL
jgi:hypothetical protein